MFRQRAPARCGKLGKLLSPARVNYFPVQFGRTCILAKWSRAMQDLDGVERAFVATVYLSVLVMVAALVATTVS